MFRLKIATGGRAGTTTNDQQLLKLKPQPVQEFAPVQNSFPEQLQVEEAFQFQIKGLPSAEPTFGEQELIEELNVNSPLRPPPPSSYTEIMCTDVEIQT